MLNGNGLPLNPSGRCGLAGRGYFPRFGPNRLFLYALFQRCDINDDNSSNNSSFSANSNDINLINVKFYFIFNNPLFTFKLPNYFILLFK